MEAGVAGTVPMAYDLAALFPMQLVPITVNDPDTNPGKKET